MEEELLFEEVEKLQEEIEHKYSQSKEKVEEINKDKIFALGKEQGFDEKYMQQNGLMFTYKMYNDLLMFYKLMDDYKLSSIRELREKLDKI